MVASATLLDGGFALWTTLDRIYRVGYVGSFGSQWIVWSFLVLFLITLCLQGFHRTQPTMGLTTTKKTKPSTTTVFPTAKHRITIATPKTPIQNAVSGFDCNPPTIRTGTPPHNTTVATDESIQEMFVKSQPEGRCDALEEFRSDQLRAGGVGAGRSYGAASAEVPSEFGREVPVPTGRAVGVAAAQSEHLVVLGDFRQANFTGFVCATQFRSRIIF